MADFILMDELRKRGVKCAKFTEDGDLLEVEFFQQAPSIPALDYDTLVPPAPAEDNPPNEPPRTQYKPPPALAALLTKPSVS